MIGMKMRPSAPPKRTVPRLWGMVSLGVVAIVATAGLWMSIPAYAQDTTSPAACAAENQESSHAPAEGISTKTMMLLLFTFLLSIFLGVELITKVPSQLHTPLMSGSNAISGITIVGAIIAAGHRGSGGIVTIIGVIAMICAAINVAGGYLVTDRMLRMFKGKEGSK